MTMYRPLPSLCTTWISPTLQKMAGSGEVFYDAFSRATTYEGMAHEIVKIRIDLPTTSPEEREYLDRELMTVTHGIQEMKEAWRLLWPTPMIHDWMLIHVNGNDEMKCRRCGFQTAGSDSLMSLPSECTHLGETKTD